MCFQSLYAWIISAFNCLRTNLKLISKVNELCRIQNPLSVCVCYETIHLKKWHA